MLHAKQSKTGIHSCFPSPGMPGSLTYHLARQNTVTLNLPLLYFPQLLSWSMSPQGMSCLSGLQGSAVWAGSPTLVHPQPSLCWVRWASENAFTLCTYWWAITKTSLCAQHITNTKHSTSSATVEENQLLLSHNLYSSKHKCDF